jgi:hypothetical protein
MPLNASAKNFEVAPPNIRGFTNDSRAVAPSRDKLDFQMPKKSVAKMNKGVFIMKYGALCFVYKHPQLPPGDVYPCGTEQQTYQLTVAGIFVLLDIT